MGKLRQSGVKGLAQGEGKEVLLDYWSSVLLGQKILSWKGQISLSRARVYYM